MDSSVIPPWVCQDLELTAAVNAGGCPYSQRPPGLQDQGPQASNQDKLALGHKRDPNNYHSQPHYDSPFLTLSALPQISKPHVCSVLPLSSVSFVSPLPSSVNLLFLLVHCLCNDAETTGRLSAGSPTTSTLQNSPSCDWSLDFVNNNKKKSIGYNLVRFLVASRSNFHDNWALFTSKRPVWLSNEFSFFFSSADCFRVNIFLTTGHFFHVRREDLSSCGPPADLGFQKKKKC